MARSSRTILIVVAVASIAALASGISVAAWYETNDQALKREALLLRERAAKDKVPVFYYAKDVPAGEIVTMDALESKEIEASRCLPDAVDSEWVAVDRVAKRSLQKGDPVRFQDFGLAVKRNVRMKENQLDANP